MNYQPPQPGGGAPPPGGPPCACGYFPTGQFCEQCGAPNHNFQGGGQPPFPPPGGGYDQGGQPQFPPGGGYDPNQPPPGGQPQFPPSPGGYDPHQGQQPGGYPSQPPQQDPYGGGFPGQPQQDPYGGGFDPNQGQQPGGYPSQPQYPPGGQPPQQDPYGGGFPGQQPDDPYHQAYPGQQMSAPPTSAPPGVPAAPFQQQQPTSAPPGPGGYSIPDAQPHDPAAAFPPPGQGYGQQPGGGQGTGLQWVLVATADRTYFSKVAASEEGSQLQFPDHYQPRRFPLDQAQINIGRYNARRGTTPQIDLSGEASDPGVSSQHAMLQAKPDGSWSLTDTGSSNGTFLNGGDDPLPSHVEMPVGDGSYFHVGAWTRLTLHYEG